MNSVSCLHYGVVGHPIAHSQSPFIHQTFARQTGIALDYQRILAPLDGFDKTIKDFFAQGGQGLNVTVPFKQQAFEMARPRLSQRAAMAAAVNTLWQKDGQVHGCNTDGEGLVTDLARLGHPATGKRILLLGAGGAARGAAVSLLQAGCATLHIANRTPERANTLRSEMAAGLPDCASAITSGPLEDLSASWDIVINATASGLDTTARLPVQLSYSPASLAYDMMYGAAPTHFLQQAQEQGAKHTADGLGMLVGQAAVSFSIWHGIMPDIAPVLEALRRQLHG